MHTGGAQSSNLNEVAVNTNGDVNDDNDVNEDDAHNNQGPGEGDGQGEEPVNANADANANPRRKCRTGARNDSASKIAIPEAVVCGMPRLART